MEPFDAFCPTPPDWYVPWEAITTAFEWVRALADVPQDPHHHAEGDVATHTRMACEALAADPSWRSRSAPERTRLFAAVLLHDAAKPFHTRHEDGRVTTHGHSRGGDLLARRLLWELGVAPPDREHVAALIRHHRVPFWALERDDLNRIAFRASLLARNDDLVELARADARGRICADRAAMLDTVDLYAQWCADLGCLDTPRQFASDHARFSWFRNPGRDPAYPAYDDTTFTVTIMSGLPATGKDTWIAAQRPDQPVVSLDAIRQSLHIPPTGDQGPVVAAARDQARALLRAHTPFTWNATNITRQMRERIIGLCADYHARVEIIALETTPTALHRRNRTRANPVPEAAIRRMINRWEAPDLTEAHSVTTLQTSS